MLNEDEKKIQAQLFNAVSDEKIPSLNTHIKAIHLEHKEQKRTPWYRNKVFYGILTPAVAAGLVLAIVLPLSMNGGGSNPGNITNVIIDGNSNQLAFSLLSSAGIVNNTSSSSSLLKNSFISQSEFEEHIDDINPYMLTIESMLKNNFVPTYKIVENVTYDEQEYDYLMTVESLKDSYNFYYNEVDLTSHEMAFEDEQEFHIEGIILINDNEYRVRGDKEIEKETDESEYELTLRITLSSTSYLEFEQEIERETGEYEEKYVYSLYSEGEKVYETELEFELEDGIKETSIKYKNNSYEAEYLLLLSTEGALSMNYKNDNGTGKITIDIPDENHYLYTAVKENYSYLTIRK